MTEITVRDRYETIILRAEGPVSWPEANGFEIDRIVLERAGQLPLSDEIKRLLEDSTAIRKYVEGSYRFPKGVHQPGYGIVVWKFECLLPSQTPEPNLTVLRAIQEAMAEETGSPSREVRRKSRKVLEAITPHLR